MPYHVIPLLPSPRPKNAKIPLFMPSSLPHLRPIIYLGSSFCFSLLQANPEAASPSLLLLCSRALPSSRNRFYSVRRLTTEYAGVCLSNVPETEKIGEENELVIEDAASSLGTSCRDGRGSRKHLGWLDSCSLMLACKRCSRLARKFHAVMTRSSSDSTEEYVDLRTGVRAQKAA